MDVSHWSFQKKGKLEHKRKKVLKKEKAEKVLRKSALTPAMGGKFRVWREESRVKALKTELAVTSILQYLRGPQL